MEEKEKEEVEKLTIILKRKLNEFNEDKTVCFPLYSLSARIGRIVLSMLISSIFFESIKIERVEYREEKRGRRSVRGTRGQ